MLHKNSNIEGRIENLVFGAKGLLRVDGFIVFVPFTIPDERVLCKILKLKKNYGEAALLKVLSPHPERAIPKCPYYGKCGGCQLQHMSYPLQLEYKQNVVNLAVSPIFPGAKFPLTQAPVIWAYRRHITLTLRNISHRFHLGYIGLDNHTLIEVATCPIFNENDDPILDHVRSLVLELKASSNNRGKVVIAKNPRYILHFHFHFLPTNFVEVAKKHIGQDIQGIAVSSPGRELFFGDFNGEFTINGLKFSYHLKAFLQNHFAQSVNIYSYLEELVRSEKPNHLIDLYCGIGVTSLLAASYAKAVSGVEWNKNAVEMARKNAQSNQISHVDFFEGDVERLLPQLIKQNPDMAIINPPRIGISPSVLEILGKSTLKKLVYVSCHPATLARDLKRFKEFGFSLEQGKTFDMFPQTAHVESVSVLIKQPSA